jgi:hypothetical protein
MLARFKAFSGLSFRTKTLLLFEQFSPAAEA